MDEPDPFADTAAVTRHPRVVELGEDAVDQRRAAAFAWDLAAWLAGAPREALAPLARVVTALAGPSLRDARALSEGQPLLAVEAAAAAAAAWWPHLRWLRRAEEDGAEGEAPASPRDGAAPGGGGGAGPGGAGQGAPTPSASGPDPGAGGADPDASAAEEVEALLDGLSDGDGGDATLDELRELARAAARVRPGAAADALGALSSEAGEAAWKGARDAEEVARTLGRLVPGLGWGAEPGVLQRALLERVEPFVGVLSKIPELRALAERLGRIEHDARARRRGDGGSEEVAGVRMSGDATRALPSELALLGDPATEDLFYARWLERQLVSLELAGRGLDGSGAPGRRGPVIAALDTSGSMNGEPGRLAKATLIAVMRQVVPQGRAVHVLLFGAAGELRELRVGGGRSAGGLDALIELCALSFGGGTDFDTPLARALDLLEERAWERADLMVVTDGLGAASPALEARVAEAVARRGVRCVTVLVGDDAHGVRGFSGEIWPLASWLERVR